MPLRCLDHANHSLDAVAVDPDEWATLTVANRRDRHLRMHCCGSPVVLKTSRLGTRFFAHHVLGGCASGDESPEHLHLKALAIAAARAAGWDAEAEVSGVTADGDPWRADVLATRGKHRVAVEVQWSGQADDETARRQARYAASGVRALWLFRRPGFAVDPEVPAVRVRGTLAAGLTALGLPAEDFLTAVFDRRLRFGIGAGSTATVSVSGAIATCWGSDCGALTRVATSVAIVHGGSSCRVEVADLGGHPTVIAALAAVLPADPLRGRIRVRRATGIAVTGCFRCDRPVEAATRASRTVLATVMLPISREWAAMIAEQSGYAPVWSVVAVAHGPAIA
jgi:hypothetical protein